MRLATDVRRIVLCEQANAIGDLLLRLSNPKDMESIKSVLSAWCTKSTEGESPGRCIGVKWKEKRLHLHDNQGGLPQSHLVKCGANQDVIVGRFTVDNLSVSVIEQASAIRSRAKRETLIHLSRFVGLASIAAMIVDIAMVVLIVKPTKQLVDAVARIQFGQFEIETPSFLSSELNNLSVGISTMAATLCKVETARGLEMQRARNIQNHLLPRGVCVTGLEIVSHFEPAEQVAGDIYGIKQLPDKSWLIYIADLVGHGVPAALSAAVLKMLIESAASNASDPATIINRVNRLLPQYLAEGEFATAAVLRWVPDETKLSIASAGHESVLLMTEQGLVTLDSTGIPLGVAPESCWGTRHHQLRLGDRLLLATDGIVEAFDDHGFTFGRSRLAEMFTNSLNDDISGFAKHLKREVAAHRGSRTIEDDTTFLVAECRFT